MTSMASSPAGVVIGGVDTHGRTHHAAVIDSLGRHLGDREFPASPTGYRALAEWLVAHGELEAVGVEGTGSYGAGLARYLRSVQLTVVEVNRSDRQSRRAHGKSDPLDAYAAARAVVSGLAAVVPKLRDGRVEAIRALRVARSSAVKARTQATNQIKALIVTGPPELREQLRHLRTPKIVSICARLRPGNKLGDPEQATKTALRRLARRHQQLSEEISEADHEIAQLVGEVAPDLLSLLGVGPEVAGQLLTSAGDNPDRITSEAAFAHLCGVAPVPASSGRIHRHRLNRGGDRHANNALYIIVLNRLRYDPRSRAYAERRTQEGLSKSEIIRCLKRYVAREIYNVLVLDRPVEPAPLICSGRLSSGRGEAPPGWVLGGASSLRLGDLGLLAGRVRDAGQADIRGLVTAGRCCSAGAVRLSRVERHPHWTAHSGIAGRSWRGSARP